MLCFQYQLFYNYEVKPHWNPINLSTANKFKELSAASVSNNSLLVLIVIDCHKLPLWSLPANLWSPPLPNTKLFCWCDVDFQCTPGVPLRLVVSYFSSSPACDSRSVADLLRIFHIHIKFQHTNSTSLTKTANTEQLTLTNHSCPPQVSSLVLSSPPDFRSPRARKNKNYVHPAQ